MVLTWDRYIINSKITAFKAVIYISNLPYLPSKTSAQTFPSLFAARGLSSVISFLSIFTAPLISSFKISMPRVLSLSPKK